ncbi:hypothetical protein INS49_015757 [Diaporthe citri]|uniref:uncharacterized protein n=1 Tax=Diaporthe citri TaxID=83186 RepID=UPI001C81770E|nr:uncharacterized protein INS49_015757 [Diaporthe citri]KAG6356369.1 hypothetical protein INS49_015757 [Diaporthe citri]
MFLDAIQQSPGLRTLAPPFHQQTQPDADADADADAYAYADSALIPSWGRYYRARRRASEHLIHGLTHKPSSSRAGVLLTDFAIGAAIGAVAAVAAVAVIACAIAVAAGLTLDVVSGVVIDAAIRVAVVCMRGGARLAASFVASLLAGAARVRKVYASRGQKQTIETSAVVLPARSTTPPRRSFAPWYVFGSTQARQPSTGLRPLRLAASAGVRLGGGSPAAQRYSDWKKDKGVSVFATIALEQWKQRVTSRIRRRS